MVNTSILILFFLTIILVSLFCIYYFLKRSFIKKSAVLEVKKSELENSFNELNAATLSQSEEKEKFEIEKKKTQEKNKKIWQMSETVYIEKKKVDEQLQLLQTEKEKLEEEKKKVDEKVKKLWSQSMAIHAEKEKINEIKVEIELQHREVIDSVNYAKRIQEAILPSLNEISVCFPHSFVLFKPKNIVSGDFYWFSQINEKIIIASIDCTGHGVPGAFMSVIGSTLLNQIVNEKGITDPAEILDLLDKGVNHSLHQTQTGSQSRDGMDAAICCFEFTSRVGREKRVMSEAEGDLKLHFAGANRPLYYIKNNILEETKADKFSIGGLDYNNQKKFTTHTFLLKKNDSLYISTDGFADQFGQNNKKLKTKKFKEILLSIQDKSMQEQKNFLDTFIENWRENLEQTDDIQMIGIRV
ncbi:MAG: SpoIIE family protein phosphatase [Bacteroidia bacterium]|nr:SpoIIE family protein phosphatase [Bacteroidia bacterium]